MAWIRDSRSFMIGVVFGAVLAFVLPNAIQEVGREAFMGWFFVAMYAIAIPLLWFLWYVIWYDDFIIQINEKKFLKIKKKSLEEDE